MKNIQMGDLVQPSAYAKQLKANPDWLKECFSNDSIGYVIESTFSKRYPFQVCWFPAMISYPHGRRELKKVKEVKN